MPDGDNEALRPLAYSQASGLRDKEVRLFGPYWGLGVYAEPEPLSDGTGRYLIRPTHVYRKDDPPSLHENVFAVTIEQGVRPIEGTFRIDPSQTLLAEPIGKTFFGTHRRFQLLQGRLALPEDNERTRLKLLKKLWDKLNLERPEAPHLTLFYYPDGFGFHAALRPPWGDAPLEGWFKLTALERDAADTEYGLVLCSDTDLPGNMGLMSKWREASTALEALLKKGLREGPAWLSLDHGGALGPEGFSWKCGGSLKAVRRAADGPFHIRSQPLRLRLSPGANERQSASAMELVADRWQMRCRGQVLEVEAASKAATPDKRSVHVADYTYDRAQKNPEQLRFANVGGAPLELAVPLIETAGMIRSESGLSARTVDDMTTDPVGPLWTFTALENGLLHWPFPDATLEGLESLLGKAGSRRSARTVRAAPSRSFFRKALDWLVGQPEPSPGEPLLESAAAATGQAVGAMLFGNDPNLEGYTSAQRTWRMSVTGGFSGGFTLKLERSEPSAHGSSKADWILQSARAQVTGCSIAFDGALQIVPFAQNPTRLLPDLAECALTARSVRALSPSLLRGLEKDMWDHAASLEELSTTPAVRGRLLVHDFMLAPPAAKSDRPAALSGRVQLDCLIRSRLASSSEGSMRSAAIAAETDPSLRPWLWTRHDRLPMVQTQPLALSGDAASMASSTRELFPLVRKTAAASLVYSFENALEMSEPFPRLVIQRKGEDEAPYRSATEGGDVAREPGGERWTRETGMAMLSLPSVTVFPGNSLEDDFARVPAPPKQAAWRWPTGNGLSSSGAASLTVPIAIEVRHDLAWRDEFYAQSRAQATGEEDAESAASNAGRFEPLPNNAPQNALRATSYHRAWASADRAAALAATDRRTMIERRAEALAGNEDDDSDRSLKLVNKLVHFWGKDVQDAEPLDFSTNVDCDLATLRSLGSLRVGKTLRLTGLPSVDDLSGYSGKLGQRTYRFGTGLARADGEHGLEDQSGLASSAPALDAWSELSVVTAGDTKVVSTIEPLTIGKLSVWLVDIPLGSASGPLDWGGLEGNHRHGYRWAVNHADCPNGTIPFETSAGASAISFEPLRVTELAATSTGHRLVIEGCFFIETGKHRVPAIFPESVGDRPRLVIERQQTGWSWRIEPGVKTLLRLEQGGPDGARAAVLELNRVEGDKRGFADKAKLHIDLFGRPVIIPVAKAGEALRFDLAANDPKGDLRLQKASVELEGIRPAITLEWGLTLTEAHGETSVELTAQVRHPDYGGFAGPTEASLVLASGAVRLGLKAELSRPEFGASELAFTWNDASAKKPIPDTWLAPYLSAEKVAGAGALFALLDPIGTASFKVTDHRLFYDIRLTEALVLRCAVERGTGGPAIALTLVGKALIEAGVPALTARYEAELQFDHSPVATIAAPAAIAAHVRHTLKRQVGDRGVRFATVQFAEFKREGLGTRAGVILMNQQGDKATLLVLATDPSSGSAACECFDLPPPLPVVRSVAQDRLAAALSAGQGGGAGWADRLLRSGEVEPRGAADEAFVPGACDLDAIEALADDAGIIAALSLSASSDQGVTKSDYARNVLGMVRRAGQFAVAAPEVFLANSPETGYSLIAPDVREQELAVVGAAAAVDTAVRVPADAERWRGGVLAASAPWASLGLFVLTRAGYRRDFEFARSKALRNSPSPGLPWPEAAVRIDPGRVEMPAPEDALRGGYLRAAGTAVDLSLHAPAETEEGRPEVLLAAHALQRSWQQTSANYSDEARLWLSLRDTTAFRPSRPWPDGKSRRLSRMLSPGTAEAAAAQLFPGTAVPSPTEEAKPGLRQSFAPPQIILREVSARPGAFTSQRLGLSWVRGESVAVQPEMPFHARAPRPPLLAKNDRPRTNEFSATAIELSPAPRVFLYGERRRSPLEPVPPQAVTRAPRRRGMWIGDVIEPADGILADGVLRAVRLAITPTEHCDPGRTWQIPAAGGLAQAIVAGRAFAMELAAFTDGSSRRGFELRPAEAQSAELANAMAALPGRGRVLVRFELDLMAPGPAARALILRRLVSFDLLVGSAQTRSVMRPCWVQFEDPALDDMLVLPATTQAAEGGEARLAADRGKVRPDDRLTLAWRPPAGVTPAEPRMLGRVEGRRRDAGGAEHDCQFELAPFPAYPARGAIIAHIECANLTVTDFACPVAFDGLRAGDRLIVSTPDGALTLGFEVVNEPVLPTNPAAYALLERHDAPGRSNIAATLFAQSPRPEATELLDPLDLLSGVARFAASYRWTHFIRRQNPKAYFLQKIAGDGGTFIASSSNEWLMEVQKAQALRK